MFTRERVIENAAVDMDGTLTAKDYELAEALDIASEFVRRDSRFGPGLVSVYLGIVGEIQNNPHDYPFTLQDPHQPIASAVLDHYLLTQKAIQEMIEREGLPVDGVGILYEMYAEVAGKMGTHFDSMALPFIYFLNENFPGNWAIVTNSKEPKTRGKLATLLGYSDASRINIVGDAGKLDVSSGGAKRFRNFPWKSVYRKPVYEAKLASVFTHGFEKGVMVGDSAEIDLLTAREMGAWGYLVESSTTPSWERSYARDDKKMGSGSLAGAMNWIEEKNNILY